MRVYEMQKIRLYCETAVSDCRKSLVVDVVLPYFLVFIYDNKLPIVLFVE